MNFQKSAIALLHQRLEFHRLQAAKASHTMACYERCLIDLGATPADPERNFIETRESARSIPAAPPARKTPRIAVEENRRTSKPKSGEAKVGGIRDQILAVVRSRKDPFRASDLAKQLPGVPLTSIATELCRMCLNGDLRRAGRGLYNMPIPGPKPAQGSGPVATPGRRKSANDTWTERVLQAVGPMQVAWTKNNLSEVLADHYPQERKTVGENVAGALETLLKIGKIRRLEDDGPGGPFYETNP